MDWQTLLKAVSDIYDKNNELDAYYLELWKTSIVFSWRWWLAVGLIVLPWTLWLIVRKRESAHRLLFVGAAIAILSTFLDMVGIVLGLWFYPITVFPFTPSYIPFDLCALPVATMLWLQFFPKWNFFFKALVYAAVGTLFDFICDSIGLTMEKDSWLRVYTFIILFLIYLLAYRVSKSKRFEPV
jgi:hypothetical protein